jgi:hypothetical protein
MRKLGELIIDPETRRAFHQDAEATLHAHGLRLEDVPRHTLQTLRAMSPQELAALGKLGAALGEDGQLLNHALCIPI